MSREVTQGDFADSRPVRSVEPRDERADFAYASNKVANGDKVAVSDDVRRPAWLAQKVPRRVGEGLRGQMTSFKDLRDERGFPNSGNIRAGGQATGLLEFHDG